jgi:DNA polymerase-3 subunit gamma/tau
LGRQGRALVDLPAHEIQTLSAIAQGASPMHLAQVFDTLFTAESAVRFAGQPKLALEMACFRLTSLQPALPIDVLIEKLDRLSRDVDTASAAVSAPPGAPPSVSAAPRPTGGPAASARMSKPVAAAPPVAEPVDTATLDPLDLDSAWNGFYEKVSRRYPALAANLARSRIKRLTDTDLVIEVNGNAFNAAMVQREKNKQILTDIAAELFGRNLKVAIAVTVDSDAAKPDQRAETAKKATQDALNHPLVSEAVDIFRGKIVDVKVDQEERQ